MRQQLPKEIDPFRFAQQGREIEGELNLEEMERLADLLYSNEGKVEVKLKFDVDNMGTPFVRAEFATTLSLTCERCMGAMEWPVSIETSLGLVKHEKLAESLAEQYEPWVLEDTASINPADLVEDELILSLPIVAKHEHDCLPEEALFSGDKETEEGEAEKPDSPFAVLSALKTKK
jgi:uncharacterized protein